MLIVYGSFPHSQPPLATNPPDLHPPRLCSPVPHQGAHVWRQHPASELARLGWEPQWDFGEKFHWAGVSCEKAPDSFGGSRWANGAKNGFTRCAVIFTTSANMYNLDQFSKHPCF